MWVDPRFKKRIKKEAVNKDMSVLELTAEIASDDCELMDMFQQKRRKRRNEKENFRFRF